MRRGEVWWAHLPRPIGRRPVVLLSRDTAYRVRTAVTVAPVTRTVRDIPVEIPLGPAEGLSRRSVANADTITTIPKHLLRDYAGVLSVDKVTRLDEAIRHYRRSLDIDQTLAGAHYGLAFLLLKRGDPDGAAQHLKAFLAQPPKGPDAQKWIEHATIALHDLGAPPAASPPLSAEAP